MFDGVGEAKEHFKAVLNGTAVGSPVEASELRNVLALYADYCVAAPGHEVDKTAVNAFRRQNNDERPGGIHAVTTCFYVHFEDGTESDFSYGKAVSAIASHST
ncbi:DUF3223 domain-containing protein [Jannaschia rubra]|uniref:DUF3223 domain-containing protein n=1 Tax=Jannaschia rubra TaxID=282197 RepID=UPI0009428BC7|nr:DUF3223 domain-containing protein [Jannaschia rubra]